MKKICALIIIAVALSDCNKGNKEKDITIVEDTTKNEVINDTTLSASCDMKQVYADNAKKVTIASGVWGTISAMEGDCMPTFSISTCKHCAVKRTVKIFELTKYNNAKPSYPYSYDFYDSFSTKLIAQVNTDNNGFYQVSVPAGRYTIAIIEKGKLYANGGDSSGIRPFTFSGGTQKVDVTMTYKAYF